MEIELFDDDTFKDWNRHGTFYNILPCMKTYVLFNNNRRPKTIVYISINHNTNNKTEIETKNGYFIVTLYTTNNTYVNIDHHTTIFIKKKSNIIDPKINIFLSTTYFIKMIVRWVYMNEIIEYGKELQLDHDIDKYQNECRFDNMCFDVLHCNEEINRAIHSAQNLQHDIKVLERKKIELSEKTDQIPKMSIIADKLYEDILLTEERTHTLTFYILFILSPCFFLIWYATYKYSRRTNRNGTH